ncbi:unnamed protein product [Calicophoron daubneyi]|uniref:Condensin complex subunit 1 C-terminal domain-containing protein n=1 Tax=Calicophoron daubneyi TaxID=300641 RepID=A0AAV2T3U0_CALDB
MMDISSLARRYACKTLTAMVLQSPAAKLTPQELQNVLDKEVKRLESLEELLGKVCPYDENEAGDAPELEKEVDGAPIKQRDKTKKHKKSKKTKRVVAGDAASADQCVSDTLICNDQEDMDESVENEDESDSGESDEESLDAQEMENVAVTEEVEAPPPIDGAEIDAAAALEAAIHSAAAIASNSADISLHHLRSASGAHAELSAEVSRQRACVAYLRETSAFSSLVSMAIQDYKSMLASKTLSDVTEAIDFFVTAKHAGIQGLDDGIRQIFIQIWSQDEPVRKSVVDAFRKLYLQLDPDDMIGPSDVLTTETADTIVTHLSRFIHGADVGSMVSLEKILQHLIETDQLNHSLMAHFWRRFVTSASEETNEGIEDSKSMLLILQMIVKSGPQEFDKHLDTLFQYGLRPSSDLSKIDLERVKLTCLVLLRMIPRTKASANSRTKNSTEPFRLPKTHELFSRLCAILVGTVTHPNQTMWIPMMEQAIAVIYELSESPELTATKIIGQVAEKVVLSSRQTTDIPVESQPQPSEEQNNAEQAEQENQPPSLSKIKTDPEQFLERLTILCPSFLLSRFMSLAGHVCLKQLVHLESAILTELKRRAALKDERESKSRPTRHRRQTRPSRISAISTMSTGTNLSTTNAGGQTAEEECGLVGASADDTEVDFIRHICDHEMITEPNHYFTPLLSLVTYVCSNPTRFSNDIVQASASLALAKMMLVNAEVCEPRLQLLFTMAERNHSEVVRANLVVALGDLCRRFPNLIEPWTPNLYARLRDNSARVRTNALNTLSHLILNDMIKVKGQISEMTVCFVDKIERLNVLARQFFTELARKGNALYNVVPDIISRLSDPDIGVSEEDFHTIMEFLLPLIGRERLCETLVEKVCARFRTTRLHRQWRDLAYTLTAISFNERMMRVLYENISAFADKLCLPEVHACFELLIGNAKKFTKPDGMPRLEEFEAKIKEASHCLTFTVHCCSQ